MDIDDEAHLKIRQSRSKWKCGLKVLERAGLISRDRDAQRRPSRLEPKPLAEVTEWLEGYRQFWEASFRRLDGLLGEMKATAKQRKRSASRKR